MTKCDRPANLHSSVRVVHNIHAPVSARSFVMPMVEHLNRAGISTQLWLENRVKQSAMIAEISVPKQFIDSDLVKNPILALQRVVNYRRLLRTTKPQVVHTHQTRASIVPLLAAYLERIPVRIYHNHGLPYLGHRGILRWLIWSLDWLNIKLATHVLFVSYSTQKEAEIAGLLPANKGYVLAYGSATGMNIDNFELTKYQGDATKSARQKFNIPEDAFVLAYIGRPYKHKGFNFLLEAWHKSGLADGKHFLIIAGCSAADCDRVLGHPIEGVIPLGYLTDLTEFYAACDVMTLPSEYEGLPYSLLEGAAAGKPLLATDIPGNRCAIQHQVTGLLIPPKGEREFIAAIRELADNPQLRSRLGKNARYRIEREFTTDIVLGSLLDFYINELNI